MFILSAFIFFAVAMVLCLVLGLPSVLAIAAGLVVFFLCFLHEGWKAGDLFKMAGSEMPKAWIVLRVMFFIGALTGLWRSSGTIAYIIYWSARFMPPRFFVLCCFLLTSLLSYLLGSSFAVCGTAGIILMVFARSGGVSVPVAAGAILSGIYFGDRGAPTSSCLSLVSALSGTDVRHNVRACFKTALPAYLLILALYTLLSLGNPLETLDGKMLEALSSSFTLSYMTLLPAILMFILPVFGLAIWKCMGLSALVAFLLTLLVQGESLPVAIEALVLGFKAPEAVSILSGGGIVSMWTSILIIPSAAALTGILSGTRTLDKAKNLSQALSGRIGKLGAMALSSAVAAGIFCSQSVSLIVISQMLKDTYDDGKEMAMDMANSGVLIAVLIPWTVTCSVPLSVLGVKYNAIGYAFLLYLVPLVYIVTKRFHFRRN